MDVARTWAIRNPPMERHERATCDVRAYPDAIYSHDVEVVPADQLRGAVEALRKIAEGEVPLGQWGELSQAMQRFAADAWDRAGGQ
jgi:hypothetical protein